MCGICDVMYALRGGLNHILTGICIHMASGSPANNDSDTEVSSVIVSKPRKLYFVFDDIPDEGLFLGDILERQSSGYVLINRHKDTKTCRHIRTIKRLLKRRSKRHM